VSGHDPQGTLVSSRNEADELRRRIANPGIPEDEVEMDLGETGADAHPTHVSFVPSLPPRPSRPAPVPTPPPAPTPTPPAEEPSDQATEVPVDIEVEPIDIEVRPGTTRVSLNVRLVLNLKR
jgi:hypothetical protein